MREPGRRGQNGEDAVVVVVHGKKKNSVRDPSVAERFLNRRRVIVKTRDRDREIERHIPSALF